MATKPIRLFGDSVLRTPMKDFDKELRAPVKNLTDTTLDAPGLATVRGDPVAGAGAVPAGRGALR